MKFNDEIPVFGDTSFRGKCPVETAEQVTFFNWLKREHTGLYAVAIHPKNEGKRSAQQAMRQRAEGSLNKGASDVIIPGSPSFIIEMKRKDHTQSSWEAGQQDYLVAARDRGCYVAVALGWEGAREAIEHWMSIAKTN